MSGIVGPRLIPTPPSFADTKSFQLDGNIDFVTYADNSNLSFGDGVTDSPFSISAWIKVTTGTAFIIVGKYLAYPNGEYKFVKQADGTVLIRIISGNNELSRRGRTTNSIDSLVGQWVHVVSTYNGNSDYSGLKIYIDGVRSDVANNGKNVYTAMSNTTYPLNIGKFANTNVNEVSIFNSELSQSEVLSIFNGGLPDSLTAFNPLLWLRMGEEATWNGSEFVLDNQGSIGGTATSVGILPTDPNPTTDVPLFDNKSFTYDGVSDYVSLSSRTQNFTDFTISVWFKTTPKGGFNSIIGNSGNEGGLLFAIVQAGAVIRIRSDQWDILSAVITDDVWHHLAVTYDSSANELKSYVDNSLFTTLTPNTPSNPTNSHSFNQIGQRTSVGQWLGNINDLSVFSNVLSSSDVTTIFNGGVPNNISALSPIHYWRAEQVTFDGTDWTLIDQGSGGNNGLSSSMPLTSRTSDVPLFDNKSFAYDGIADYVDISNAITLVGDFSISAWIKPSNTTDTYNMILSCGSVGPYFAVRTGGKLHFYLSATYETGAGVIQPNVWSHVAVTRTSGVLQLYTNGVAFGATSTQSNVIGSQTYNIGRYSPTSGFSFTGNIDETSIFNTALTQTQVTEIYNGGIANDISNLNPLSYWRSEFANWDGSNWTMIDQGSGANNGTSQSMPLTSRTSDVPT